MSLRHDEDFVVNDEQMKKLVDLVNFMEELAEEQGGRVEPVKLVPREENGSIVARFVVLDLYDDDVQRFCDVVKNCSALGIEPTNDGVLLDFLIPGIFIKKQN